MLVQECALLVQEIREEEIETTSMLSATLNLSKDFDVPFQFFTVARSVPEYLNSEQHGLSLKVQVE